MHTNMDWTIGLYVGLWYRFVTKEPIYGTK